MGERFGHGFVALPGGYVLALFLAAAAVLAWLHLRRRRPARRILVSSEALWADLPGGPPPGRPTAGGWRRWRPPSARLLLHLLVAAALTLAAGDPRPRPAPGTGRRLLILVDTSASMGAFDDGPTRLERARARAAQILQQLSPGQEALLASFARRALVRAGWTEDRRRLAAALAALEPQHEESDLPGALAWLKPQIASHPGVRAVIITDEPLPGASLHGPGPAVELVRVGRPAGNVAIRGLTVERAPGDPDRLAAELLLTNLGDQAVSARISLRAADQPRTPVLASGERALPAGGSAIIALSARAPREITVEARLEGPALGATNALALDDRARALVPRARYRRVLVVGARNLYLEGALLSFGRELIVEQASPAEAERRRGQWPTYDMVVFDGWTPARPPAAGRYLWLGAGAGSPFVQRGSVPDPVPDTVVRGHPLVRQLSMADLNIKRAGRLVPEPDDEIPLAAGGVPLILARSRGSLRLVATSFDPRLSDLPLRPAFPLLLANALDWLGGSAGPTGSRRLDRFDLDVQELDLRRTGQRTSAENARPAGPAPGGTAALAGAESELASLLLMAALVICLGEWGLAFSRRRRRGAGEHRRRWLTSLPRALVVAAIALALAGIGLSRPTRQLALAVLLDVSASVDPQALARAATSLQALDSRARQAGREVVVHPFRFAGTPLSLPPGTPLRDLIVRDDASRTSAGGFPLDRSATDLPGALFAGLAGLPGDRLARVLVLSDGHSTVGDLGPAVQKAIGRARIFTRGLPSVGIGPVTLEGLGVTGSVREGAPFDLEATLWAAPGASVRLELEQLGTGAPVHSEIRPLVPGRQVVTFPARLGAQTAIFRLRVRPEGAGARGAPQTALLAVAAEPRPRVLALESRVDSCLPLRRALLAERMIVDRGAGPLPPADRLAGYDLLVLCDLPIRALAPHDARALVAFVRERGGGLLVTGGQEGWGADGYQGTALAGLLPLEQLPPARKEEATAALALVIDRSGSMSGPKIELAKEAARASAALMNPLDLISVVAFDSQANSLVRLQPAGNRQRILGDIGSLRSGGGTNILAGLREAIAELQSAPARRKHVILLSDGQSPAEGIAELVEEAAASHITVSAVGVGDGADLPLLQLIASRGGGRFHHTRDPASLPRIFTRETAEVTSSADDPRGVRLRSGRPAEALRGIPLDAAPPLFGHSPARERPGAEVLLRSDRGQPLLARWPQGIGQVMIWSGDFSARWSGEWRQWRYFGQLWGQLARSLMLRRGAETLPLEASVLGDEVWVRLRAFAADDRPRRSLRGTLAIEEVLADGSLRPRGERALVERAPGEYEARFARGHAAALLLRGRLQEAERADGPGWQAAAQLALWPPAEWPAASPGQARLDSAPRGLAALAEISRRTGGAVLADDLRPVLEVGEERARRTVPLRPWLAIAALVLFLADIALRRANFRALS